VAKTPGGPAIEAEIESQFWREFQASKAENKSTMDDKSPPDVKLTWALQAMIRVLGGLAVRIAELEKK
jgi:hypothetical protein